VTSVVVDPVEVQRRFADYAHYHAHLKIRHRDTRQLVAFKPNRFQRRLYNRMCAARSEGRPFRAICLKARQLGCSTWTQTFFATEAFTKTGIEALTISHEDESSKKLHAMLELMYDNLPSAIQPAKDKREQGKALALTHGSAITVRTAGARESGRSFALTHLHASELAYWPDAATTLTALRQTMQYVPGTFELVESTANGIVDQGQVFHDEWYGAVAGETGYEAIFEPWFEDAAYRMPAPAGMVLDEEERELERRFGVTSEQLAWRRWKIATLAKIGGVRKFRQEFPSTPDEAFLVSGRPFFDAERVAAMPIATPVKRGRWRGLEHRNCDPAKARWLDDPDGNAVIYRLPHPDHKYVVGVDVAGQVETSEAEAFSQIDEAEDYSVITVVDRLSFEVVAQWRDRIDIGLVGYYAAKIGRVYNHALMAVEDTGGYGKVVLDTLKRLSYSPQYHREVYNERGRKVDKRKIGWATTEATRPLILEGLVDMLREHPERLRSEWLQREMRTFIKGRRPEAAPGHHDDVVMSTAIALQVAKEYPQALRVAA
jgi:hypothetical protein